MGLMLFYYNIIFRNILKWEVVNFFYFCVYGIFFYSYILEN